VPFSAVARGRNALYRHSVVRVLSEKSKLFGLTDIGKLHRVRFEARDASSGMSVEGSSRSRAPLGTRDTWSPTLPHRHPSRARTHRQLIEPLSV
jgi:hypothetical protein